MFENRGLTVLKMLTIYLINLLLTKIQHKLFIVDQNVVKSLKCVLFKFGLSTSSSFQGIGGLT